MRLISNIFIGKLAHFISTLLVKTYRANIFLHPQVDPNSQYLYGFWHGQQFTHIMLLAQFGRANHVGLVSASRDGEILSTWLSRLGYRIVRGSSSRKATSSVVKLLSVLKEGHSIGIAADGPRGPQHQAKSGISFLAHKAKLQIVPLGAAYSTKLQFAKAWDKYELPLPWAKVVVYFGEPLIVEALSDIEALNQQVAEAINAAQLKAEKILRTPETELKGVVKYQGLKPVI